jgi:hypothetical protein
VAAPDGTPGAAILASADQEERGVALRLFAIGLHGGELVVCDKGYAGRDFEQAAADRFGARILRPPVRPNPAAARSGGRASSPLPGVGDGEGRFGVMARPDPAALDRLGAHPQPGQAGDQRRLTGGA